MKILKFIIVTAIVLSGWISYWHNRPPYSSDMIIIGIMIAIMVWVAIGFIWALKTIANED